jgi:nucleoside-diphosphate-sugar epimerase
MRIVVTGGTGKGGGWVVRDLLDHGHEVRNVDVRPGGSSSGQTLVTDLTDLGQAQDALSGYDAVVHFAAIPAPGLRPEGETFRNNALSTYNVFQAAVAHRMRRVVWASSETVLGLPFDIPPAFAPIDETIEPRPESSYALSKLVGETMAAQLARRSGIGFVGFRISNIMEPGDYARFPSWQDDPSIRKWNLWGYVDARDVAQAVRLALEAPIDGAEICIVAAADTVMTRPSAELMAEVFPTVPLRRPVEGRETLLSIGHARQLLGYEPAYRWMELVAG